MFANSLMLPYFDYLDNNWNKATKTSELDILYKKIAKIALDYDILECGQFQIEVPKSNTSTDPSTLNIY